MSPSVLVTGASSGIGKTTVLHLAGKGFRVFAGVRKKADAEALTAESGGQVFPVLLDVTDQTSILAAAAKVDGQLAGNGLQGLVNNAGIVVAGPLEFLPVAEIRRQLEVNVTGQIAVTQAFLPLLRKAQGRIVNIGSISGKVASPFLGPYSASKFALEALSDALRRELFPWGLEVILLEPGKIQTPIWTKTAHWADDLLNKLSPQARALYARRVQGTRRFAEKAAEASIPPVEVARVVELALTAKRPKTRYLVGKDARQLALLARILPDRWLDRVLRGRRRSGVKTKESQSKP